MAKVKILGPIREEPSDFDKLEELISREFREQIYLPLMRVLDQRQDKLDNSSENLAEALRTGRITFYRGEFKGKLNATLTKELKSIGAKWSRTTKTFKLNASDLPADLSTAISTSRAKFDQQAKRLDAILQKIVPEDFAGSILMEKIFDATLWKTDRKVGASLRGITIEPVLTDETRARVAREYTKNMQLYIKDWTQKEIVKLRKEVQASAVAGNRYESMVKTIQDSYGVSKNKAKFLARQETSLLMTKFKQDRYENAGVREYIWTCVAGSPNHPVRPMHKKLDGKLFSWNAPPIVNEKGDRKNPGQDYNCRCSARPVVKFDE